MTHTVGENIAKKKKQQRRNQLNLCECAIEHF